MWAVIVFLLLALVACGADPAEQELAGAGGSSPQAVVQSFIEDLNQALADPALGEVTVRRSWAERLASHFTPSERADQRTAMTEMLANFAASTTRPAVGTKATLEITFSGIDLIERQSGRALVRVIDGTFVLRFLDAEGEIVRERTAPLTRLLGQTSDGLPVQQVGTTWFMTEG